MQMQMQTEKTTERAMQTTPGTAPGGGKGSKGGWVLGLSAATVVVAGLAFAVLGGSPDSVSQAQIQARQQAWDVATSKGPIAVTTIAKADYDREIPLMGLAADQEKVLRQNLDSGKQRLVFIGVFDNMAIDGDCVRLSGGGVTYDVVLGATPTGLRFPAPVGGPLTVTLEGTYDGGGGITEAVIGAGGAIDAPVLAPGQKVTFQVQ